TDDEARAPHGADARALADWQARHRPWIADADFARYREAKRVYARTNLGVHQLQRGFDYALVHPALSVSPPIRRAQASGAPRPQEGGERCALGGERQALGLPAGAAPEAVDAERQSVREVWARLDPNSDGGAERLCAVCAMKRVLVRAGVGDANGEKRMAG